MKLVNPAFGEAIKVSGDPTEANITSSQLIIASSEAIPIAPGHQAMLSGVALKRVKAEAYLSSEVNSQAFFKAKALSGSARIASFGEANALRVSDEATLQACLKAKVMSGGAKIASSDEAKAYYKAKALSSNTKIASSGEANTSHALGEATS